MHMMSERAGGSMLASLRHSNIATAAHVSIMTLVEQNHERNRASCNAQVANIAWYA